MPFIVRAPAFWDNLESIFASDLDHSITSFANIFIHMEIHIEGNFDGS